MLNVLKLWLYGLKVRACRETEGSAGQGQLRRELLFPWHLLRCSGTGAGKQLVRLDRVSVRELNSGAISNSCHRDFGQEETITCGAVGCPFARAQGVEVGV